MFRGNFYGHFIILFSIFLIKAPSKVQISDKEVENGPLDIPIKLRPNVFPGVTSINSVGYRRQIHDNGQLKHQSGPPFFHYHRKKENPPKVKNSYNSDVSVHYYHKQMEGRLGNKRKLHYQHFFVPLQDSILEMHDNDLSAGGSTIIQSSTPQNLRPVLEKANRNLQHPDKKNVYEIKSLHPGKQYFLGAKTGEDHANEQPIEDYEPYDQQYNDVNTYQAFRFPATHAFRNPSKDDLPTSKLFVEYLNDSKGNKRTAETYKTGGQSSSSEILPHSRPDSNLNIKIVEEDEERPKLDKNTLASKSSDNKNLIQNDASKHANRHLLEKSRSDSLKTKETSARFLYDNKLTKYLDMVNLTNSEDKPAGDNNALLKMMKKRLICNLANNPKYQALGNLLSPGILNQNIKENQKSKDENPDCKSFTFDDKNSVKHLPHNVSNSRGLQQKPNMRENKSESPLGVRISNSSQTKKVLEQVGVEKFSTYGKMPGTGKEIFDLSVDVNPAERLNESSKTGEVGDSSAVLATEPNTDFNNTGIMVENDDATKHETMVDPLQLHYRAVLKPLRRRQLESKNQTGFWIEHSNPEEGERNVNRDLSNYQEEALVSGTFKDNRETAQAVDTILDHDELELKATNASIDDLDELPPSKRIENFTVYNDDDQNFGGDTVNYDRIAEDKDIQPNISPPFNSLKFPIDTTDMTMAEDMQETIPQGEDDDETTSSHNSEQVTVNGDGGTGNNITVISNTSSTNSSKLEPLSNSSTTESTTNTLSSSQEGYQQSSGAKDGETSDGNGDNISKYKETATYSENMEVGSKNATDKTTSVHDEKFRNGANDTDLNPNSYYTIRDSTTDINATGNTTNNNAILSAKYVKDDNDDTALNPSPGYTQGHKSAADSNSKDNTNKDNIIPDDSTINNKAVNNNMEDGSLTTNAATEKNTPNYTTLGTSTTSNASVESNNIKYTTNDNNTADATPTGTTQKNRVDNINAGNSTVDNKAVENSGTDDAASVYGYSKKKEEESNLRSKLQKNLLSNKERILTMTSLKSNRKKLLSDTVHNDKAILPNESLNTNNSVDYLETDRMSNTENKLLPTSQPITEDQLLEDFVNTKKNDSKHIYENKNTASPISDSAQPLEAINNKSGPLKETLKNVLTTIINALETLDISGTKKSSPDSTNMSLVDAINSIENKLANQSYDIAIKPFGEMKDDKCIEHSGYEETITLPTDSSYEASSSSPPGSPSFQSKTSKGNMHSASLSKNNMSAVDINSQVNSKNDKNINSSEYLNHAKSDEEIQSNSRYYHSKTVPSNRNDISSIASVSTADLPFNSTNGNIKSSHKMDFIVLDVPELNSDDRMNINHNTIGNNTRNSLVYISLEDATRLMSEALDNGFLNNLVDGNSEILNKLQANTSSEIT